MDPKGHTVRIAWNMYPLVGKINAQHKSNNHTHKFYDVSFGFEGGQVDVYFPSLSEWPVFPIGPLNLAIHQRLEWPLKLVSLSILCFPFSVCSPFLVCNIFLILLKWPIASIIDWFRCSRCQNNCYWSVQHDWTFESGAAGSIVKKMKL